MIAMSTAVCVLTLSSFGAMPRADGGVLHADLENYTDGVVQALNAGVRWLGDPFSNANEGVVQITRGDAFAGARCAHVATESADQIGRVRFQPRFDAPKPGGDSIAEFVYRPTADGLSPLNEFVVWSAKGSSGQPAGVTIIANSDVGAATYRLDVIHAGQKEPARTDRVVGDVKQNAWIRIVLHRERASGTVRLFAGAPDNESLVGTYPDLDAGSDIHQIEVGDTSASERYGSGYWDDIRIGNLLAPGATVAAAEPALRDLRNEAAEIEAPIRVGRVKQLFVDDAVIESMENVSRTMYTATKHPKNPLMVASASWETGGIWFLPYDVIRETPEGALRVWYGVYPKAGSKLTYTCVAESRDGIEWTRPTFGLFEVNGSKDNNIVWQGRAVKPNFDPRDPDPARRYKAMTRSDAFTPLFSPDGIHWTEWSGPVISQAYDATSFHWDPIGEKWIASCKIFRDGKRARGYAESRDYVNWSDTYFMLAADELDQPQDETYAMRIFRYESVYIGLLKIYHVATDRCDIQLAFSRNGRQWQRPFRTPFLANGDEPGTHDYGNLDEAGEPIRIGDELRFYYAGRSLLHNEEPRDSNGSLNAATLRLDGFVSLDAASDGVITSKPVLFEGKTLYMNADAKEGSIRVELLGGDGQSVRGYAQSEVITGDAVRMPVRWANSGAAVELPREPVRIRFSLSKACLFSYWVE
ncbi:MAG: hypothetical protein HUU46_09665 [Candidatus Hydrogenedentes bacterium]|nr:hypothetical protein [Candidatus Hydrogenedentota bacterium]